MTEPAAVSDDAPGARDRLLAAALRMFAQHGYHAASTRDICKAAGMNNASLHYHFGDKATIYRELVIQTLDNFEARMRAADLVSYANGRAALRAYYGALLRLEGDERLTDQMRLQQREDFEPTGIVEDLLPRGLDLLFEFLGGLVQRELTIQRPDAAVRRLVLSMHGSALIYLNKRRAIEYASPSLVRGPKAMERLIEHLTDMGMAMIEVDRAARAEQ